MTEINYLHENNFPVTNEGLYLIANNKLIRYCKNETNINREVECVITKYVYDQNPQSISFSFDYPHCPCTSDLNSICKLTTHLNNITFGSNEIKQPLYVTNDLNIKGSNSINEVIISNDITLTITNSRINQITYVNNYLTFDSRTSLSISFSSNSITVNDCNNILNAFVRSGISLTLKNTRTSSIIYNSIVFTITFDVSETTQLEFNDNKINISFVSNHFILLISSKNTNNYLKSGSKDNNIKITNYNSNHLIIYSSNEIDIDKDNINGNYLFISSSNPFKSLKNCSCLLLSN